MTRIDTANSGWSVPIIHIQVFMANVETYVLIDTCWRM